MRTIIIITICFLACFVCNGQIITTIAGTGIPGYNGDNILATAAELVAPVGVAPDKFGNLYVADAANGRIRKIDPSGIITTFAGTGTTGESGMNGPATIAQIAEPVYIAADDWGNVYFNDGDPIIWKVNTSGIISVFTGSFIPGNSGDGGQATAAQFGVAAGVAIDKNGNLYVADNLYNVVRKINATGTIVTYAGVPYLDSVACEFGGDGGPASAAQLCKPSSIAVDSMGNLYICDFGNDRIRKVDGAGTISTVAGSGSRGYSGDGGAATAAQIGRVEGLAADNAGNIYISDNDYSVIRKVTSTGIISTYAGTGIFGYSGDNGPAIFARLNQTYGIAVDNLYQLYIADYGNRRVRKLSTPNAVAQINKPLTDVTIYPNPAHQAITITATGSINEVSVSNVLGQVVLSQSCNANNVAVDISELAAGVYFVTVNNSEVSKFVKE